VKVALALLVLLCSAGAVAIVATAGEDPPSPELVAARDTIRYLAGQNMMLRDRLAKAQKHRKHYRLGYLKRGRLIHVLNKRIANLDRVARHGFDYPHLIRLAAIAYGYSSSTLERKARCESVNFTDFYNEDSHASGVFQFLPSTWRGTPYGRFNIFDPFANVLAGAWMHARGRGGEWVCR